jgi:hypothetical protein
MAKAAKRNRDEFRHMRGSGYSTSRLKRRNAEDEARRITDAERNPYPVIVRYIGDRPAA